jgi:ABC-type antimicrobial peptide transport system permease subunit
MISTVLLRLNGPPGIEFAGRVRQAIFDFDPRLWTMSARSLEDILEESIWYERFTFRVLKILAALGLVLATVGMFSIVTYTVGARRREFGVRLALGATPRDLRRLVLSRSLVVTVTGIAGGLGAAGLLTRYLESVLFETTAADPAVLFGVSGLLLAASMLASWLPARRAARIDPVKALRSE